MSGRRCIKFLSSFFMAVFFLALALSHAEASDFTTEELRKMTESSAYADWQENLAFARGVGRLANDSAQGRLLARRAALLDAQRNLLILRTKILEKPGLIPRTNRVSGSVPPLAITGERVENGLYFVSVEMSLTHLLGKKLTEKQSLSSINP